MLGETRWRAAAREKPAAENNHSDEPVRTIDLFTANQLHEKLKSLPVGGGVQLAIPFPEPFNNRLNGLYQLFVRVERVQ